MKVNSLYVAAKNFERAKICYAQTIFQKSPDIEFVDSYLGHSYAFVKTYLVSLQTILTKVYLQLL